MKLLGDQHFHQHSNEMVKVNYFYLIRQTKLLTKSFIKIMFNIIHSVPSLLIIVHVKCLYVEFYYAANKVIKHTVVHYKKCEI